MMAGVGSRFVVGQITEIKLPAMRPVTGFRLQTRLILTNLLAGVDALLLCRLTTKSNLLQHRLQVAIAH